MAGRGAIARRFLRAVMLTRGGSASAPGRHHRRNSWRSRFFRISTDLNSPRRCTRMASIAPAWSRSIRRFDDGTMLGDNRRQLLAACRKVSQRTRSICALAFSTWRQACGWPGDLHDQRVHALVGLEEAVAVAGAVQGTLPIEDRDASALACAASIASRWPARWRRIRAPRARTGCRTRRAI